jgi:hypothetical protein
MLWGALLGALVGVAGTVISLFQLDRDEITVGETVAAGLLIGVPVTTVAGILAGWLWGALFGAGQRGTPH